MKAAIVGEAGKTPVEPCSTKLEQGFEDSIGCFII
jgi:hypothetical protein